MPAIAICTAKSKIRVYKLQDFNLSHQASVARLVEHRTSDLTDPGSIPGGSSFFYKSKDN